MHDLWFCVSSNLVPSALHIILNLIKNALHLVKSTPSKHNNIRNCQFVKNHVVTKAKVVFFHFFFHSNDCLSSAVYLQRDITAFKFGTLLIAVTSPYSYIQLISRFTTDFLFLVFQHNYFLALRIFSRGHFVRFVVCWKTLTKIQCVWKWLCSIIKQLLGFFNGCVRLRCWSVYHFIPLLLLG